MEIFAWCALVVCCVVGLLGVVVPGLPGVVLVLVGAVFHKLLLPFYLSWWSIAFLVLGAAASFVIDIGGTVVGAKWGGASRAGLVGAGVGGVVGLFFLPVGLLIGPVVGAFVGEMVAAKRQPSAAARAGVGAGLGALLSTVLRTVLAVALVGMIVADCLI